MVINARSNSLLVLTWFGIFICKGIFVFLRKSNTTRNSHGIKAGKIVEKLWQYQQNRKNLQSFDFDDLQ